MKKQLVFLAILGFNLIVLPVFPVLIGNPSSPSVLEEGLLIPDTDWSNVQGGFYLDFLLQKKLSSSKANKAFLSGVSEMGFFLWSIRDRFNLEVVLGSGQFDFRYHRNGSFISGDLKGGLLWGADAKLVLFQTKDTTFAFSGSLGGWDWMEGAALQHERFQAYAKSLFRYWQIAVAFTQQISCFFPYLGIAWNRTRFQVWNAASSVTMHAWCDIGPFGGCSLSNGNPFLLNIEWRGWFEEGLSLSFQLRF